jgi:hypothetical protein
MYFPLVTSSDEVKSQLFIVFHRERHGIQVLSELKMFGNHCPS